MVLGVVAVGVLGFLVVVGVQGCRGAGTWHARY